MGKIVFSWDAYLRREVSLFEEVESAPIPALLKHIYPRDLIERLPPPLRPACTSIAEKLRALHGNFYSEYAINELYRKGSLSVKTKRMANFIENSLRRLIEPGGFHALFFEMMIPAIVEFFVNLLKTPVTTVVYPDLTVLRLSSDEIFERTSSELRSEVEASHSKFLFHYILSYLRKLVERHNVDGVSELRLRPKEVVIASFSKGTFGDLLSKFSTSPKVSDFDIDDKECLVLKCAILKRRAVVKKMFGKSVFFALNHQSERRIGQMAADFSEKHRKLCLEVIEWLDSKVVTSTITKTLVDKMNAVLYTSFAGLFTRFNLEAAYSQLSASMPLYYPITKETFLDSITVEFQPEPIPFIDALGSHLRSNRQNRVSDYQQAMFHNSIFFYYHYVVHWIRRIYRIKRPAFGTGLQYILKPRGEEEKKELLRKMATWVTDRKLILKERYKQSAEKEGALAAGGSQPVGEEGIPQSSSASTEASQSGYAPVKASKASEVAIEEESADGDAAISETTMTSELQGLEDSDGDAGEPSDVEDEEKVQGTECLFSPFVTSPKVSDFEINDERCLVLQSIVCLPQELAKNILGARVFAALNESSKASILEMTQTFIGKHRKICVDMDPSLKTIKNDSRPPKSLPEDICRLFSKLAAAFYLSFPGLFTRVNLEALYRHFIPKLPLKRFVSNEEFLENATIEFDTDPLRFIEDLGSHLTSEHEARLAEFKKDLFNNTMFFYFHYVTHWFRRLGRVIRISGTNGPLFSLEWRSVEERKELLEKSSHWAINSVTVREEWLRIQKKHTTRDSDGSFKAPQKEVQVEVSRAIEVTDEEEASGDAQKKEDKKKLRQLGDSAESASTPLKVKDAKKIVKKSKDIKKADADVDESSRISEELSQETSSAAFVKERTLNGNPKATEPMEGGETASGDGAKTATKKSRKRQRSMDSDEVANATSRVEETEDSQGGVEDLYSPLVSSPKITDFDIDDQRCLVFKIINCTPQEVAEKIFGERILAAIDDSSSKALVLEMATKFIEKHRKMCQKMAPWLCPSQGLKAKQPAKNLIEDINILANKLSAALFTSFAGLYTKCNLTAAHQHFVSKLPLKHYVSTADLLESVDFEVKPLPFIEHLGSHIQSGHESRLADLQQALFLNSVYFYFHYATHWFRRIASYDVSNYSCDCRYYLEWRSVEERKRLLETSAYWAKENTGELATKKQEKTRKHQKDFGEDESETSRVEETEKGQGGGDCLYSPLVTSPKITDFEIDDERCLVFQINNCTPQEVAEKIFGERVFAVIDEPSLKAAVLEMTTKFIENHRKLCVDLAPWVNPLITRNKGALTSKNLKHNISILAMKASAALFTSFPGLYTEASLLAPRRDFVGMLPLKSAASKEQIFDNFPVKFDRELVPFIQDFGWHIRPCLRISIADFQQALFYNSMYFFFHYATHWFRRIARVQQFTNCRRAQYLLEWRSDEKKKELLEKSAYWAMNRTAVREEWLRMQGEKHKNKDSKVRRSIRATEELPQGPSTSAFPRRKVSAEDLKVTEGTEVVQRKSRKRQRSNDSEEREIEDTEKVVKRARKRKRLDSDSNGARSITATHEPEEYETPRAKSEKTKRMKRDRSMDSEASANGTPTVHESKKTKRRKKEKRQSESDLEIIEVVSAEEAIERKRKKPCEVVELSSDEEAPLMSDDAWELKWKLEADRLARDKDVPAVALLTLQTVLENSRLQRFQLKALGS